MLRKAVEEKKGNAPPPTKPDLAKQLFPSSSPTAHDGNIARWATSSHKARANLSSSTGMGSSKAAGQDPLQPRSNNLQQQPRRQFKPVSSTVSSLANRANSVASLCGNAGSFQEAPSVRVPSETKPDPTLYFDDDDFSDDIELDLEYRMPDSLPTQPTLPKPVPASSQMTWSSSPAEHSFPPPDRKKALKRESPDNAAPLGPPPAKKRSLPNSWRIETSMPGEQGGPQEAKASTTLAPKEKKTKLPWESTQNTMNERRKQLKDRNKKSDPDSGLSMEDIRAATENHARQKAKASAMLLSSEQQHVIDLVIQQRKSVFFTGPAGTGKSVLMRSIIAELKKKWSSEPERLSVTASTGLAACNIGGMTLHSFAGIGLGKEDVPSLVKKIRRNPKAKTRWLKTKALIIDEVSMVDGELFDKLSQIARTIRNNGRPWGGIQLIITGDFFQLPPVPEGGKKEGKFSFEASTWETSIDHTIGLTQIFRQRDPQFANMLNEMRLGKISEDTVRTFKDLSRPLSFDDGLEVTELFPTRYEVDKSNESRLRNLPGELYRYEATDSGEPDKRERLLSNMMAPKSIDLKKGAQVMLIKNMDESLVNGSLGKVIGFMSEATFDLMNAREGADSGDGGETGLRPESKIKSFMRDVGPVKDVKEYPIVRFTTTDGAHRTLMCSPEDWKVELPTGEVQAARKQLPLILAWALSIHKAQGQTLERVKVDLGKVFEKGQAYVALSRAVSKQGLQVLRFDKSKVMAHARVIQFYNKLYSAESAIKTKKPASVADFAYKTSSKTSGRKTTGTHDLQDEEEAMAAYG